jgi:hypothetical protein
MAKARKTKRRAAQYTWKVTRRNGDSGTLRGRLASGVGQLNRKLCLTDAAAMVDHALQGRFAGVGIKPEATVGDRPWRSTWVASITRSEAPEFASMPKWVMCQSSATPSLALYWHMGETAMRLARSRSASFIGENRALVMIDHMLAGSSQKNWTKTPRWPAPDTAVEGAKRTREEMGLKIQTGASRR